MDAERKEDSKDAKRTKASRPKRLAMNNKYNL